MSSPTLFWHVALLPAAAAASMCLHEALDPGIIALLPVVCVALDAFVTGFDGDLEDARAREQQTIARRQRREMCRTTHLDPKVPRNFRPSAPSGPMPYPPPPSSHD